MLTDIFLKGPFSVRSMFSSDDLSSTAGKMRKNYLFAGGFRDDLTESQPAFCKYFKCQNRSCMVFETGY